ncbi:u3 small nucleolar RNA-associated protein 14-like protein [Trichonephila clavata]|uniref:U3 small nucleolar RNA-associated protein 14-like protein n=1 Tax=Trichonephila clavata TaxID=2740835 RepID=A0A8X6L3I4_TRICU|nr:u3 small nucleolar RNA-associated protein 14-like protein [Trichonephila clavata]
MKSEQREEWEKAMSSEIETMHNRGVWHLEKLPEAKRYLIEDQIIFPLKKPDFVRESFEDASERFVTKHPVEIAMNELLKKSDNVLKKDKKMTEAEEKALKAMSLEEARLRHDELMKHNALLSYQEAKVRRQHKIKSKRYRRMLRKEKVNKLLKEVEELEKVDPEKALEKIMEADRVRIMVIF